MSANPYAGPDRKGVDAGSRRRLSWLDLLVISGIVVILIALLMPPVRMSRGAARRTQCLSNLRQVGLALLNYARINGGLPPAYTVDTSGNRLHSWRTLILPYLGEQELYDSIDLTKPWNDPANADVFESDFSFWQCPGADLPRNYTTYVASAGPDSCFHQTRSRRLTEIVGDTSNTVMVVEVSPKQAVHWMSPYDNGSEFILGFGPKTELAHEGGTQIAFADGSVRFVSADLSQQERRHLVSVLLPRRDKVGEEVPSGD